MARYCDAVRKKYRLIPRRRPNSLYYALGNHFGLILCQQYLVKREHDLYRCEEIPPDKRELHRANLNKRFSQIHICERTKLKWHDPYHLREIAIDLLGLSYYQVSKEYKKAARSFAGVHITDNVINTYFTMTGDGYILNSKPDKPIEVEQGIPIVFPQQVCLKKVPNQSNLYIVEDNPPFVPKKIKGMEWHHISDVWDNRQRLRVCLGRNNHSSHCTVLHVNSLLALHYFGIYLEYTASHLPASNRYTWTFNTWHK